MIKQFFHYSFGTIGAALFSLLTVPFLTRVMLPSEYGKGMLYITLISLLFYLANCGMDQAFVRFFYEKRSFSQRSALLYICVIITLISFSTICIILGFSYHRILKVFFGNASISLYLLICLGGGAFILNRFVLLILRMQERALLYSIGTVLTSLIYFISIYVLYFQVNISSFELIAFSQIISLLVSSTSLIVINLKYWGIKAFNVSMINKQELVEIVIYAWPFIFTFILTWGIQSLDRLLLVHFSDFRQVGIYAAAFSLTAPLVMFQTVFTTLWAPIMNKKLILGAEESKQLFSKIFFVILFLLAIAILILLLSRNAIICLLGASYREAVGVFMWILFMPLFYVLSEITTAGIVKSKKSKWNLVISFVTLLVNVICCTMLIPKLGALGAALSLAISYAVFFVLRTVIAGYYYSFDIPFSSLTLILLLLVTEMLFCHFYNSFWLILIGIGLLVLMCGSKVKTDSKSLLF